MPICSKYRGFKGSPRGCLLLLQEDRVMRGGEDQKGLCPGDRVALLTYDGQTFYLVARTVRV